MLEDMGSLGGNASYAVAINSSGQAAGYSNTSAGFPHGMVWGFAGPLMEDLGTLGGLWSTAYGINDVGQVVGYAYLANSTTKRATLWNKINGIWTPIDLGTYSGYNSSTAYGINNFGQIVGDSVINLVNSGTFAMIWNPGMPIQNLGGLGGSYSTAYGINDAGQVVGYANLSGDYYANALVWEFDGNSWSKTDLGTLSGSYNTNSVAYGINSAGQIVGISYLSSIANAPYHATLWSKSAGIWAITDLGTLGGTNSWAHGINSYGQIVGYSNTANGEQHAALWDNGTIMDLNDLVEFNDATYLKVASSINNSAQIVASGSNGHTYLLTPISVPEAPKSVTAIPGDSQATVSFAPPDSNGGSAITTYTVISNPGAMLALGNASPITMTGLTNGTTYTFTVTATNLAGTSPESAPSNSVTPQAPIRETFTLKVDIIGTGSGSIEGTTSGIPGYFYINTSDSVAITNGATVNLQAIPGEYSLFTGWLGACSNTGSCIFDMNDDKNIAAEFTLDSIHMVWIDGTTNYYSNLQSAYYEAPENCIIKAWGTEFAEDLTFNSTKVIFFKGGYDMHYISNNSYTVINGMLSIQKGSLTVESIVIR